MIENETSPQNFQKNLIELELENSEHLNFGYFHMDLMTDKQINGHTGVQVVNYLNQVDNLIYPLLILCLTV